MDRDTIYIRICSPPKAVTSGLGQSEIGSSGFHLGLPCKQQWLKFLSHHPLLPMRTNRKQDFKANQHSNVILQASKAALFNSLRKNVGGISIAIKPPLVMLASHRTAGSNPSCSTSDSAPYQSVEKQ